MSRSSSDRIKPQASSHCPSAGSSNATSLGSAAADDWPKTGNVSTTRLSPSCASPPSASCCENYAIPHDVLGQTLRPWHVWTLLAREPGDLWIGHRPYWVAWSAAGR